MSDTSDPLGIYRQAVERNYGAGDHYEAALRLISAERKLMQTIKEVLTHHGINRAQWSVLTMLHLTPSHHLPPGRIAQTLGVHGTTITNAVDALVRRELVERVPDHDDRRSILTTLTPNGEQVADSITRQLAQHQFGLDSLSVVEVQSLSELLKKLAEI